MKFTESEDGLKRANLNVKFRVSIKDIADQLILKFQYEDGMSAMVRLEETTEEKNKRLVNTLLKIMNGLSKTQILKITKEGLEEYGTCGRCYEVSDQGYEDLASFLEDYLLKNQFKQGL